MGGDWYIPSAWYGVKYSHYQVLEFLRAQALAAVAGEDDQSADKRQEEGHTDGQARELLPAQSPGAASKEEYVDDEEKEDAKRASDNEEEEEDTDGMDCRFYVDDEEKEDAERASDNEEEEEDTDNMDCRFCELALAL
jgi:hypothetical protein